MKIKNLNINLTKIMTMKNLLVLIMVFATSLTFGQNQVDKLFEKYDGKDGFTTVTISSAMFELISKIEIETSDEDVKNSKEIMDKLEGIKILACDDHRINSEINFYDELLKNFPKKDYKELMRVKEDDQKVLFLIKEKGKMITELLLVVGGKGDNALISIKGDIDLKNISKLASTLNYKGMEKLKNKKLKNIRR